MFRRKEAYNTRDSGKRRYNPKVNEDFSETTFQLPFQNGLEITIISDENEYTCTRAKCAITIINGLT